MPQYDGSIRIDTGINTKGFEEGRKELEADTRRAAKSINASIKEMQKEFDTLDRSIEKTAQTITSLTIEANRIRDLHIPTKEYSDAQKEVDKYSIALQKAKEKIDKLLETGVSKESSRFISAQYDVANLENKLLDAEEIVKRLEQEGKAFTLGSDTEEFTNISNQIEDLTQKMHDKQQKQLQLQSDIEAKRLEEIRAEAAEEERLGQIRANAVAANDEIIAKVERIKQLEQEIADLKKVERTEGYVDYDNRIAELSKLKQEVKEYSNNLSEVPERFSQMHSAAQKAFDAIRSGLSKIGSIGKKAFSGIFSMAKKAFDAITSGSRQSNASLSGGLKTILKYGLGIRSLYALFNKIRSGMQQGFKNLMDYSGDFANSIQSVKNSMSMLGNQIAAAFAPIVQMVIPWLNQLINVLSTAITYVAQFIATLTGASTFTRAKKVQDAYNKSLSGTAKAADKARGALAKFDDLDVLQKQEDNAVGGAESITGDLFEEVPISDKFKDLVQWLKDMWENSDFYELGKLLGEKLKEALDNIPWEEIKETVRKIGKSFASLINGFIEVDGLGYSIGRTLSEAFNTGFEFLNAFVHELHWESIGHFIADTLNGFFENIDWELIKDTFITGFKGLADAINQFITDFHWDNISETISNLVNIIAETIYTFFSETNFDELGQKLGEQLRKSIEKIDWEMVGMALGSVVQAALDFLKSFIGEQDMRDIAQAIMDTLKGFFEVVDAGDLATAILTIIAASLAAKAVSFGFQAVSSAILHSLGTAILTGLSELGAILGAAASAIASALSSAILPALAVVAAAVAGWHIGSWIAEKLELDPQPFNETMQGIKDSFTDGSWKDALRLWGDDIYNAFVTLGERQEEWWESVKTTWSNAWENIKETVSNILTSIKNNITNKFNEIKTSFETFKTNVSTIWTNLWNSLETKVSNIITSVKETLTLFFTWVSQKISGILNALSSIGTKVSGFFGGGSTGAAVSAIPSTYSAQSIASFTDDLPHLASGSVIRGGNPFMAILGDQRVGQTNIEAPLSTIEQAVDNVLSRRGYGAQVGGSFNPVIALNVNGEEFARLTLNDIFQEAARQGYDVSILGVT